jgi:exopolyphosphatase/guanosine-5'-triphosphate,3'-diphosphate pyrophosphatase
METLAAIDIGSNALRLVIGQLDDHHDIKVLKKVREPVRLGKDVFSDGEISRKTIQRSLESFEKFHTLIDRYGVKKARAVATSALREAKNRESFVAEVAKQIGLKIDIIDGMEEARLIHSAVAHKIDLSDRTAVLIDIGGGSVELTVSVDGVIQGMKSFKIGTVRLLRMLEERGLKERNLAALVAEPLKEIHAFVEKATKGEPIDFCVGTGGNIECLGKLRVALLHRNSIYSLTVFELSQILHHLEGMSLKERIQYLRLRPDRADVVVPAGVVVHAIMREIPCETLMIPYVGLRDGILSDLALRS